MNSELAGFVYRSFEISGFFNYNFRMILKQNSAINNVLIYKKCNADEETESKIFYF